MAQPLPCSNFRFFGSAHLLNVRDCFTCAACGIGLLIIRLHGRGWQGRGGGAIIFFEKMLADGFEELAHGRDGEKAEHHCSEKVAVLLCRACDVLFPWGAKLYRVQRLPSCGKNKHVLCKIR